MRVTNVAVKPADAETVQSGKLVAYCVVTFDDVFVVRDVKVIRKPDDRLFVAMPSRKVFDFCPGCCRRCAIEDRFCAACGKQLPQGRIVLDRRTGRPLYYCDIAHPITHAFRDELEQLILDEYKRKD